MIVWIHVKKNNMIKRIHSIDIIWFDKLYGDFDAIIWNVFIYKFSFHNKKRPLMLATIKYSIYILRCEISSFMTGNENDISNERSKQNLAYVYEESKA